MFYESALSFLQSFLKNLHLDYYLITKDTQPFPSLDLGLRKLLRMEKEYSVSFDLLIKNIRENIIYKISDSFFCHYVFLLLPDMPQATIMAIGPYTSANVSDRTVIDFIETSSLPAELTPHMVKYYKQVPILWEDGALFAALNAFGEAI